ncbi:efflux transporter periplasmic adaptor subunit [Aquabacterium olei]|jgi:cobalt-zinc-cadmium efflux system membrane fusion protein|uniref:Efflux transporter periplasmic adaptor subunit n=1 Tax=Aquabacterium olei TaxID=1296669 RepID=A0A2U8FUQ3_9BURK|nr:efflux RND transporter periplasmic adaptor subunit [Aquabacterium olei]AWI54144.1 efflux transporter periplasmic adaptor subunit [Aquabacterium olei]
MKTLHTFPLTWSAALVSVLALTLSACGDAGKDAEAQKPAAAASAASAAAAQDPMVVNVPAGMVSQFKVDKVGRAEMAQILEVSGRIEANERQVARIGAGVTGRVTQVLAEVGDRVRPGQVLAHVASPELSTAQLNYLRANASTQLAERAVERARQLIQADVIGSAELLRRESELAIARAELRAAGDQLALVGIPRDAVAKLRESGSLFPHAAVLATQAGVVIERKVSQGQVAQPGDPLFTVADLNTVWVVGSLPEQAARNAKAGQSVEIDVPAIGKQLSGRVVYVADTVSPETRTVPIRTQVDNADQALKPQMLATMLIAGQASETLAIPSGAVVRDNDRDHVYVQTAANRFRLTPVELGPASGGKRPVLKGLSEGTPIVIEGAFHLNNERKRAELE